MQLNSQKPLVLDTSRAYMNAVKGMKYCSKACSSSHRSGSGLRIHNSGTCTPGKATQRMSMGLSKEFVNMNGTPRETFAFSRALRLSSWV